MDCDEAILMSFHIALRDLHEIHIPRYVCLSYYQQVQVKGSSTYCQHKLDMSYVQHFCWPSFYIKCIYFRTLRIPYIG